MKYLNIIALIILIPVLTFGQAASESSDCGQTVKELESRITKITQDLDKTAFEKFVSDDALFILADGETTDKKQQAQSFPKAPPDIVFSFSSENIKTRVCTETTIITTGKDILKATNKKTKETGGQNYWFTRIYEKRQGQWQLIFNQLTSTNE